MEAIKNDLELPQEDSDIFKILYTALSIRSVVREAKGVDIKSGISSADICDEKMEKIVPEQLFLFLSVLMCGKRHESPQFDHDMQKNVLSVAQDILFPATSSRCIITKHIVSMKHITGSKMASKLLHNLGHSISYEDVSSLDSAVASNLMTDLAEDGEN